MRKLNKVMFLVLSAWSVLTAVFVFHAINRLTYLEFTTKQYDDGNYVVLSNAGDSISEDFYTPYQILKGLSFRIGTFARDNNSEWTLQLLEKESQKVLAKKDFGASLIVDNQWHFIDFEKNLWLDKSKLYEVKIIAKSVSPDTSLAFYTKTGKPALRIYGGDFDSWWLKLVLLCRLFTLLMILRYFYLKKNGITFWDDKIIVGMLICCIVFILMFFFKDKGAFTDENDNFHGGFLIAHGRVLYRDYVVQHTPFAYYLCSLFAFLGAKSIEQFRLSYYLLEGVVYGFLYLRHSDFFGRKKIFILPILEIIILNIIVPDCAQMVLSDSIQGVCFTVLLLEYLRYCEDKQIGWKRAIIVSLCVWFSFGSAFVSAYALVWIFIAVVFMEIKLIVQKENSLLLGLKRAGQLSVAFLVPLFVAMLYFILNHSFEEAIRQFYLFNRKVYPIYTGGYGKSFIQPVVLAVQNFGNEIRNGMVSVVSTKFAPESILRFLLLSTPILFLFKVFKKNKKIFTVFVPFVVMIMSGSRGYHFHGIAAWNIAVLIITLYSDCFINIIPKKYSFILAMFFLYLMFPFVSEFCNGILRPVPQISEFESMVVDSTNDGEEILYDAWTYDSNYFFAKKRLPINKAVYMLPWYMDWYESKTIDELHEKRPRYAVFNKDAECWGHRNFSKGLRTALEVDYIEVSPNFWQRADTLQTDEINSLFE